MITLEYTKDLTDPTAGHMVALVRPGLSDLRTAIGAGETRRVLVKLVASPMTPEGPTADLIAGMKPAMSACGLPYAPWRINASKHGEAEDAAERRARPTGAPLSPPGHSLVFDGVSCR